MNATPILTYHSQNISGNDYASNDHVALESDLQALDRAGFKVVSLDQALDERPGGGDSSGRPVVLTFDDGCDFDVRDIAWPEHGMQRSFLGIMEDFAATIDPVRQQALHATSFVIASNRARIDIDAAALFAKGWISHSWWAEAELHPMMSIGNHGWDHNHIDLDGQGRGGFLSIDDHDECVVQVVQAAAGIEAQTGTWPRFFAYPYGESSPYIRNEFFPNHTGLHRCRAALGTDPGFVTKSSNVWNLPRFVCGRDWDSPESLIKLISG